MDRREFIGAAASSFVIVPRVLSAQQPRQVQRIGWLWNQAPLTPADFHEHTKNLRDLGWIQGQNLLIDQQYANGSDNLLPALAEQLVLLKVEIIVAEGTVVALAAKKATSAPDRR